MPYRSTQFANNEFFHVFNRGTEKRNIFLDKRDYVRFLFLMLHNQSKHTFYNSGRQVSHYVKHQVFNISPDELEEVTSKRFVSVISFVLMPNHFHILVKQEKEKGVSEYMQKIQNAYAKYFNTKNKRVGHLFSGPFKSVHVQDDRQLLHLSAYIHKNPKALKGWEKRIENYPWSSLTDIIKENRWGELLIPDIISERFENKKEYSNFIKTSPAKEIDFD